MTWEDLALYIHVNTHDGFLEACKGVPLELIRECERGFGIAFPQLYVDFLMAMGADACGYPPMGRQYDHNFHVLLEHLGHPGYPAYQYFRVGYQVDDFDDGSGANIMEPCLDLTRAAEGDTPVVMIPGDMGFRPEYVDDFGRTLAEYLAWSATLYFGLSRPRRKGLVADCETPSALLLMRDQAIEVLGRLGLKLELSPSPRFTCVGNAELTARVQSTREREGALSIVLAGYDDRQVRHAVRTLIDEVPGFSDAWLSCD